jgi:site-specific DNA-methyltransferase (adenine-specific)
LRVKNKIGRKYHPTEKPVELMQILIENSTQPFDTVLDPFMGSGSTGVAAHSTGRNFIGIELDDTYYEIAKNRIGEKEASNESN